tara:strand:+ start:88 stop:405 length:318 start_codon:yes stop_codon:yes gene_type:complete
MINTISTRQAIEILMKDEWASWSWEGAEALIQYYEELEEEFGELMELDSVALRCEWSEDSLANIKENYSSSFHDRNDLSDGFMPWFEEQTTYIELKNGNLIFRQF